MLGKPSWSIRVEYCLEQHSHLLWFLKEMPKGLEDIELLIGVYSSESEARLAIERVEERKGLLELPEGFQICSYQLDRDH